MKILLRIKIALLACLLTSATHGSSTAVGEDELLLVDGSRIVGRLVSADDSALVFETAFAGSLTIELVQVASLRSNQPQTVQLKNGEILRDRTLTLKERQLQIAAEPNYAIAELAKINPEPWELGLGRQWQGLVSFALAMERGNSDTDNLDYLVDTSWRGVEDRYTVRFNGQLDEANGIKNAENWTLLGKYDRFTTGSRYWGVNASLEADDFTDLNLRSYIGPYYGIQWFERSVFTLSTEFGLTYVNEDFIVAEDQDYPGANWNLDISSDYLGGGSRLFLNQVGVWNLDETSEVIVNTRMGLSFPLLGRLQAAAEILLEYDSGAVAGVDELDQTYNFRIGYSW